MTGNLLSYTGDQLGYLTRCARDYGDIVRLRLLTVPAYLLNHPDYIEHVLVHNNRNFVKSRGERHALSHLGDGLLTSEGSFWRRQRRLAQPAFHRARIEAYGEEMVHSTERMLSLWCDGQRRDVHQDMTRLTLEIVSKTLFGYLPSAEFQEVGEALAVIMRRFSGRGGVMFQIPERVPTPANRRFTKALRLLDDIIYKIIRARREDGGDTGDLLSMLLAARDEETGEGMSDKQLRDEVATIFLAGHETTANALSWTFYLLGRNPAVEEELAEELRAVLGGQPPRVRSASAMLHRHGHQGSYAPPSSGVGLWPGGPQRLRDRRLPCAGRYAALDEPVGDAPRSSLLRRPRNLLSWAVDRGDGA